jgi:hypothetical protein
MASSRRRTSYSSLTQAEEVIDELSNISEKEVEVVEEIQDTETIKEFLLPDIIPTEAPPPYSEKKVVEPVLISAPAKEETPQPKAPPKRHPRNIPKFSSKKG